VRNIQFDKCLPSPLPPGPLAAMVKLSLSFKPLLADPSPFPSRNEAKAEAWFTNMRAEKAEAAQGQENLRKTGKLL
jgi:hypothetical protein